MARQRQPIIGQARIGYLLRAALVSLFAVCTSNALADDYSAGWGPAIGSQIPVLAAPDQSGTARSLADLAGEQGLLLFLSRSADW